MPITTDFNHQLKLLLTTFSGLMNRDEIEDYQKAAWCQTEFAGYNELLDLSAANLLEISFCDLLEMSKLTTLHAISSLQLKLAVVTKTQHHEELADFYIAAHVLNESPNRIIKRFSSSEQAKSWLAQT